MIRLSRNDSFNLVVLKPATYTVLETYIYKISYLYCYPIQHIKIMLKRLPCIGKKKKTKTGESI